MNIVEAMKAFIASCPFIDTFSKGVHVDYTDGGCKSYGLMSNGSEQLKRYMDGSEQRAHNFTLFARDYTADDAMRLDNAGFLENFAQWLDDKRRAKELPQADGIQPIDATTSNGMFYDAAEDGRTGLYQIQIRLIYNQRSKIHET